MGTRLIRHLKLGRWLIPLAAPLLAGCSMGNPVMSSAGPGPRVEDCALIQQATPTKYVCNGKTYTSVQLTEIRNGVASAK